ncbi:hypothetical protein FJR11_04410 [Anabaena sp. UHCC 0187]|uniref:hypothetical protein n=1 Tax=Anabaena sp. UHCC 0187 TaxID=2590018 RepID=UPI001446359D|nr:hypothetical protein [Anabaena sp. UHCC 0187]MTJ11850.1 hypothetical protein [Anabaena sp. UHCC 0187]
MPVHCQAGDIARVTFPNGSIQDFADAPVEVTVKREDGIPPQFGTVWAQTNGGTYGLVGSFFAPIFDVYYVVEGRFWNLRVSHKAGITNAGGGSTGGRPFTNVITGWYFTSGGVQSPLKYRIKIFNSVGTEIFNQLFDTANYSVNCIQGCPPNTLDCGDCCLDCAEIFNGISSIRKILAGIK